MPHEVNTSSACGGATMSKTLGSMTVYRVCQKLANSSCRHAPSQRFVIILTFTIKVKDETAFSKLWLVIKARNGCICSVKFGSGHSPSATMYWTCLNSKGMAASLQRFVAQDAALSGASSLCVTPKCGSSRSVAAHADGGETSRKPNMWDNISLGKVSIETRLAKVVMMKVSSLIKAFEANELVPT